MFHYFFYFFFSRNISRNQISDIEPGAFGNLRYLYELYDTVVIFGTIKSDKYLILVFVCLFIFSRLEGNKLVELNKGMFTGLSSLSFLSVQPAMQLVQYFKKLYFWEWTPCTWRHPTCCKGSVSFFKYPFLVFIGFFLWVVPKALYLLMFTTNIVLWNEETTLSSLKQRQGQTGTNPTNNSTVIFYIIVRDTSRNIIYHIENETFTDLLYLRTLWVLIYLVFVSLSSAN